VDISKSKTNYYFDNLIVSGDDTENVGYIARYQPSQEFNTDERNEIGAIIDAELKNESLTYILLDGSRKTASPKSDAITNDSCD